MQHGGISQIAMPPLPLNAPGPYNARRIGWELERTALGDGYYGSAIRAAMDFASVCSNEKEVLKRYAAGTQKATDHVALQEIAHKVYNTPMAAHSAAVGGA